MAALESLEDLPELVQDSRLEANFGADGDRFFICHVQPGSRRARSKNENEKWFHEKTLGVGGQGSVDLQVKGTNADSPGMRPQYRAVKKIMISNDKQQYQLYRRELSAVFKFSQARYSDLFVRSYGWFANDSHLHIAMEYLELGDLQMYLSDPTRCPSHRLVERDAHTIACQVLDALEAMHKEGFSHRDLKPANILIKEQPPKDWWVKLADFGISKRGGEHTVATAIRGTLRFMPPELLEFNNGSKTIQPFAIDMWCFGETLFRLLTGRGTFDSIKDVFKYSAGLLGFPKEILSVREVDKIAINFLESLMAVDASQRLTASGALTHPWIQSIPASTDPETHLNSGDGITKGFRSAQSNLSSQFGSPTDEASTSQTAEPGPKNSLSVPKAIANMPMNMRPKSTSPKAQTETVISEASASWTTKLSVRGRFPVSARTDHTYEDRMDRMGSIGNQSLSPISTQSPETSAPRKSSKAETHIIPNISTSHPIWTRYDPGLNTHSSADSPSKDLISQRKEKDREEALVQDSTIIVSVHEKTAPNPPTAAMQPTGDDDVTAISVSEYIARESFEQNFPKGAQITHIRIVDDRWWLGSYGGQRGLFPPHTVRLTNLAPQDVPNMITRWRSRVDGYAFDLWEEATRARQETRPAPCFRALQASGSFLCKKYSTSETYLRMLSNQKQIGNLTRIKVLLAFSLYNQEKYKAAGIEFQILIHELQNDRTEDHFETLVCSRGLASAYLAMGQYEAAESLFSQLALEKSEPPELFDSMNNRFQRAEVFYQLKNHSAANEFFTNIIQSRKETYGLQDIYVRGSMRYLAAIFYKQGQFREALPILEELAESRESVKERDFDTEVQELTRLASTYKRLNREKEAMWVYRQILKQAAAVGKLHRVAESMQGLGSLLMAIHDYHGAEEYLQQAFNLNKKRWGEGDKRTISAKDSLTSCQKLQADLFRDYKNRN